MDNYFGDFNIITENGRYKIVKKEYWPGTQILFKCIVKDKRGNEKSIRYNQDGKIISSRLIPYF